MRIRHVKGAEEYVAAHPLAVSEPQRLRGGWRKEAFHATGPIELEIGMGMGAFLREMSLRYPERLFIGLELNTTVLYKAIRRYEAAADNLRFIRSDARLIGDYFAPGEVDTVYIHFPDPWPRAKNAGKRLSCPMFLALYEEILSPDGSLYLRTDSAALFEYSLETLSERGWSIDTGASQDSDILTEYEQKWLSRGAAIYRLRAKHP